MVCLERPVATIYLTVSPKELTRRIRRRGISGLSDKLMLEPEKRRQILRNYETLAEEFGWHVINTNAPVDKVVADVFGVIERNCKCIDDVVRS